jgi:hypothetical protein
LWRERAFEVALGDTWLSGVFDRVVIACDAVNRPVQATLFDFKTDRLDQGRDLFALAARHAGQLHWYVRALRALTGLPPAAISCEVVFTRARRRVRIAAD